MEEWINKMYMYAMKYYKVIKITKLEDIGTFKLIGQKLYTSGMLANQK